MQPLKFPREKATALKVKDDKKKKKDLQVQMQLWNLALNQDTVSLDMDQQLYSLF